MSTTPLHLLACSVVAQALLFLFYGTRPVLPPAVLIVFVQSEGAVACEVVLLLRCLHSLILLRRCGLLPPQVYSSTVMPCVRARCLATITKLLAVGSPQQLQTVLADLPISSFVAGLLTSRDVKAQAAAIQMAEILMTKLPEVFAGFFVKEGVAHALEQLAAGAGEEAGAAVDAGARAAGEGRRASGSGAGLPPPSPPITRSRRSSKADQVRVQEFACISFS